MCYFCLDSRDLTHSLCGSLQGPMAQSTESNESLEAGNEVDQYMFNQTHNSLGQVDDATEEVYQWSNLSNVPLSTDPTISENWCGSTQHEQNLLTVASPNDSLSSATDAYNSRSCSLPNMLWGSGDHTNGESLSTSLTPSLVNTETPMTMPDPLAHPGVDNSTHPFYYSTAYMPRQQRSVSDITTESPPVNPKATIGLVLMGGGFICDDEDCADLTFTRHTELRRHYTSFHATEKPNFWCEVSSCQRSVMGGGKPFHRKDKLMSHVRSMHPKLGL